MRHAFLQLGSAAMLAAVLTGCGGGSSDPVAPVVVTPPTVQAAIAAAAAVVANDAASNSSAPFTVLQGAGVPAVTVNSTPKVNFAVFSDGAVKTGLVISNVSVAIAKLVPGINGNPDEWKNYTHRLRTAATASATGVYTDAVRATLTTPKFPSSLQATTDPKQTDAALLAAQLVYNPDGYYTYTFRTDIKNPAWTATVGGVAYSTNGVTFEPGLTHRVAIQLSYTNAAGETVRVNPYFDFTIDSNGNAVAVTDAAKTRKMTDVSSCNSCHEKLALHGGGRVDTQFCVMCHNPATTDPNSGNNLPLATMVHKIHAAKLLKSKAATGGGEIFTVRTDDFSEVGFPQDLRNCTKCHSASNPATPQGDNWKTRPSKEACLTCHANKTDSDWDTSHQVFARSTDVWAGATTTSVAKDLPNSACAACHKPGSNISPERVHWNQNEENAAKYKMNIDSATYDAATRLVTVKYFVSDPTNGDAAYSLLTNPSACTLNTSGANAGKVRDCNNTRFGNLKFYLAYQSLPGQSTAVTEFSSFNNGGNTAYACLFEGPVTTGSSPTNACTATAVNDGSNHYTVQVPVPTDTATSVAAGTARIVSVGQVKEPKLQVKWATDPRPEAVPAALVNVVVQNAYKELALSGTLTPRRTVVATEKCNACHGALGTTSGSNTLAEAFHGGARNRVEACVMCHDANRSTSTIMSNGLALFESHQFKRLIHGIHGNSKRTAPFTHGNKVIGPFSKEGVLLANGVGSALSSATVSAPLGTLFEPWSTSTVFVTGTAFASDVENYAAEVAWPGRTLNSPVGINCNVCHIDNSYKVDRGPLGAVVAKPILGTTLKADPNPMNWMVISPKAATCTACHDSPKAIAHVTSFGNAAFGNRTQTQSILTQEICADCHSSGGFKGVDIVHGQK
ncbi:MAG: OmcA/MtrC family decaheme c-type cytochrome [Burkholderiaceae bacterium]|nr:OmcA/MtrC family decaheme c-type cytochrome [Burkholderiaceae bacterium]